MRHRVAMEREHSWMRFRLPERSSAGENEGDTYADSEEERAAREQGRRA